MKVFHFMLTQTELIPANTEALVTAEFPAQAEELLTECLNSGDVRIDTSEIPIVNTCTPNVLLIPSSSLFKVRELKHGH